MPLLKAFGFLGANGQPTQRYHDYRDHSRSKWVMGEAIKEAYHDLFLIKANPNSGDQSAIIGKFKSFHNASDNVAQLMAKSFFELLALADISAAAPKKMASKEQTPNTEKEGGNNLVASGIGHTPASLAGFHYNIQIHLPATKDVEVYNPIFKSLKAHLVD